MIHRQFGARLWAWSVVKAGTGPAACKMSFLVAEMSGDLRKAFFSLDRCFACLLLLFSTGKAHMLLSDPNLYHRDAVSSTIGPNLRPLPKRAGSSTQPAVMHVRLDARTSTPAKVVGGWRTCHQPRERASGHPTPLVNASPAPPAPLLLPFDNST